jgi:membrane protein implicated in regulation of membrane protease activity
MDFIDSRIFWFGLGVILFVLEIFVPGFILFFFGLGAMVTFILDVTGMLTGLNSQILCFILSSLVSLVFLRKYFIKIFKGKKDDLRLHNDELTGKTGVCTEDIIPNEPAGKVEVNGTIWSAISDSHITKGSLVIVEYRKDLKLHVKSAGVNA